MDGSADIESCREEEAQLPPPCRRSPALDLWDGLASASVAFPLRHRSQAATLSHKPESHL